MNAERLHIVAIAVASELNSDRLVENLIELTNALQNSVNQPSHPQYQQIVSAKLAEIQTALDKAPSNDFSPAWHQIQKEIGADGLLGRGLADQLRSIFQRNQITPSVALQEIRQIQQKLQSLKTAIDQIVAGFASLHIGHEELGPGEAEVGIAIPRPAVSNELAGLAHELEELKFLLGTFVELSTGNAPSLPVRTISSTDLLVYVAMVPSAAAALAHASERIIEGYKKILEIRKLHADLKKNGVPEDKLKGIEEHANASMANSVEELAADVEKNYLVVKDANRKNELKTALRFALSMLANRIDKGYNIDVRAEPSKESEKAPQLQKSIATIRAATPSLLFRREGGAPILSLPEAEEGKETQKKGAKK